MEVLPCSGVQHVRDSDCGQQSSESVFIYDGEYIEPEKQVERRGDVQGTANNLPPSEGHCSDDSYSDYEEEGRKLSFGSEFDCDDVNAQNYSTEPYLASDNSHVFVDTIIETELPNNNREEESSVSEPAWLEGDRSVALWVKWRGKWQAGIRCARADWPLSTLRAKPTHDRKNYIVIFFPHTRNYSWADTLLVRSINEFPHPIAYKNHKAGLKMVKDLNIARRFILKKLAVSMLNVIDQFHAEALIESARDVRVLKGFAMEASRCPGYFDLGRMLLKLQNMILRQFINSDWLQHSFHSWEQQCQNAQTAETIEMLKEEFVDSIMWDKVNSLQDAAVEPTLGSEWKTWKHEVMKWFSVSNPMSFGGDVQQQMNDPLSVTTLQFSRKRPKLEIRRAETHACQIEPKGPEQATTQIDSEFFDGKENGNGALPASSVANKWDGMVIGSGNFESIPNKDVQMTPISDVVVKRVDLGTRNRQCTAFIESKGRQCVRWANEGDVYCCVHLSSRFSGNSAKKEGAALSLDAPMCQGTTVLGTRCKHRSLYGSSFCKKHRPHSGPSEIKTTSNFMENRLKRKLDENVNSLGSTDCKELMLFVGDVESPLQVDPVSISFENPGKHSIAAEIQPCIASFLRNNNGPCLESPKRHSLYCDNHLPSWLKRARNGKSRIVSKEVFIDLLRDCCSVEQKIHLHQACELFYKLFKSILSVRNPVPKEVQLQWALSEASKNLRVGELFMKLVCLEKDRLRRIWGFSPEEVAEHSSSLREEQALVAFSAPDGHGNEEMAIIRCKMCSDGFLDDKTLSTHFMDSHKKEAQWLFRGYACAICLDSFTNKKVLETHVQERHHVEFVEQCMLLQCIPCGSHFGNTEQLWVHVISAHPEDFRLSAYEDSSPKPEMCNSVSSETNSENLGGLRKFICRLCGLKFDLLPDLGRHHQAAHMGPGFVTSRPSKRGIRYYAYKMKSGRLSRPRFKKSLAAASYRIRNRANNIKKRIQASKLLTGAGINVNRPVRESLGRLVESQCSAVAKILFSKIQKTKPRPDNFEILSIARSSCCKVSLKASLEQKYGLLPESLYLKAAKLCSENNIEVGWHFEGYICPKGCKLFKEPLLSPLMPRLVSCVKNGSQNALASVSDEWETDECHYVIDSYILGQGSVMKKAVVLYDDISFGKELVPVVCVTDHGFLDSLPISGVNSDGQNARYSKPWESFTYIIQPLLDPSLGLDKEIYDPSVESLQLGCACSGSTCSPYMCDHVYLFDNDFDDARDIYGQPMDGRFPYDEKGRIILEEGYLVYECNQMCCCSRTCRNRVLQNGVRVKLEVFMTEQKGWAVRAGEAIRCGTFVCEYIGEVLDEQEARHRRIRYGNEGSCYVFDVDARTNDMSRLVEGPSRYVIDATKYGNVSRFINHSCSPNLVNYQVLVESMDYQRGHIGLYANRDIEIGEELTFDYRYELLDGEGYPCHCGSSNCRGRLY